MTDSPEAQAIPGKTRQRWILACAAFATFMGTLDEFIVGISLPSITRDLRTGTSAAVWIVIVYFLMVTGTLILFGRLADRRGLKKLFLIGYAIFLAGSLFCGISWNLGILIAARAVQGLGGSILRVVAYAIVPKMLPREVRGWGYGTLSTASALGIMAGAPAGGFITNVFSWHWIFLLNIPVGIVAVFIVMRVLPGDSGTRKPDEPFDVPGAAVSFLGFCALTYALNSGHDDGWTSPLILGCLSGSAILLTIFIRREMSIPHPLLDISLFKNANFVLGNAAMFMTCMFMSGDGFLFPFFLQLGRELSASHAGLLILGYSVVYVPVAQIAGRLSDRVRPPILCGLAMISGALACLFFVATMGNSSLWPAAAYMVWAAISCAMFISPSNNNVMSHAPEDRQGSAAGILSTANQLSGVIGVCVFEAVFSLASDKAGIKTLADLQNAPAVMSAGFRHAYTCAILICAAAAAFAFLSGRRATAPPRP